MQAHCCIELAKKNPMMPKSSQFKPTCEKYALLTIINGWKNGWKILHPNDGWKSICLDEPHFIQNYGWFFKNKLKIKIKIKMLASSNRCQACALGSEIWGKNENKKGGLN